MKCCWLLAKNLNLNRFSGMHLTRLSLVFACVALMQGCVSMPATPSVDQRQGQSLYQQHLQDNADIESFSLKARIGVQTEGKGFSGSLHWQHHAGLAASVTRPCRLVIGAPSQHADSGHQLRLPRLNNKLTTR